MLSLLKDKVTWITGINYGAIIKTSWVSRSLIALTVILIILFGAKKIIDPNRYKTNIQQYILEKTGQNVLIEGDIQIQYFPFPSLEMKQVALKDTPLTAEILKIYPDIHSLFLDKKHLKIDLSGLQFQTYYIPELHTHLSFENGFLELQKTECLLIKNEHEVKIAINQIRIDTNNDTLRYVLQHHDQDFPLSFFVSLMSGKKKILAGEKTKLKVELTAEGNDFLLIKNSLAGNFEMEIESGKLHGTDVVKTLEKAKSFMGTIAGKFTGPLLTAVKTLVKYETHSLEETPFNNLTMHAKLKNGVLDNTFLNIDHHHYAVQGRGHVNLNKNTINYRIEARYKEKINKVYGIMRRKPKSGSHARVHSKPLIVNISGPLKKPNIEPDFNSYLDFVKSPN